MKTFGRIEKCFLVCSPITGQSKGYGCVEFTAKESSIRARNSGIRSHFSNENTLPYKLPQVHWMSSIPSYYDGMLSKVLFGVIGYRSSKVAQQIHAVKMKQLSKPTKTQQMEDIISNMFTAISEDDVFKPTFVKYRVWLKQLFI